MGCEYIIYIDEAGDDGLGKLRNNDVGGQSRWFTVGACCVRYENDKHLVHWRDEITNHFPNRQRRDIHFKDLKHDQRRLACHILGQKPVRIAAAFSNKITLLSLRPERLETFKRKNHLQNYLTRWLLERVSKALKLNAKSNGLPNAEAKVVFSRRGGMNYTEFQEYLSLIKEGREKIYSPGKIDWDVIDPDRVEAFDHAKRAGLQLADIATSAMFKAVEPNRFGFCESAYVNELRRVVFKNPMSKSAIDHGIIHVPKIKNQNHLNSEQKEFFDSWR